MASQDSALFLLDSASTFDGVAPHAYLERRGLGFGESDFTKRVTSVRPRITGSPGQTVLVRIGGHMADPAAEPEYSDPVPFVIGETVAIDCFEDWRYIAVRFESGTASQWNLASYDFEVKRGSRY